MRTLLGAQKLKTYQKVDFAINQQQLTEEIEALALISDAASPAVTRILFTETDRRGRSFVMQLAQEAGLQITEDAIGNIFMRCLGTDPELSPVATGSHTDAIPFSGKYDGVVGVLGAIEAIRALKRSGFSPDRSIDIIMFTAEEPTRFGIGCLGSRVLCGSLKLQQLVELSDTEGVAFDHIRQEAGYNGDLASVAIDWNFYSAFVELHIEQGPRLERSGSDIGIVTSIAAPATLRVTIEGDGGHAGAVLMPGRRDALIGAAKVAVAVQRIALECPSENAVATTGRFEVFPGAVNSIPSKVTMEIDIRDIQLQTRDAMIDKIKQAVKTTVEGNDLNYQCELLNSDAPAECDNELLQLIEKSCRQSGVSHQSMISHAYHDALFMAQICPTAMIFVPSKNGYSHRPDEYTSPQQIEKGVQVLANVLAELSSRL